MLPWTLLGTARIPGDDGELRLYQRGGEYAIRVAHNELMNSRVHASEDALATLACARLGDRPRPRILIGGLGLGFTLAAVLRSVGADAEVVVSELVPEVVDWNRGPLTVLSGPLLDDPRVTVRQTDVADVISKPNEYDAILLDVDNGPSSFTAKKNDRLYTRAGLRTAYNALRPRGIYAVWSASPDPSFTKRLQQTGFTAEEIPVRGRTATKGSRFLIWMATKP
jgi:spermidine synthase